VDKNLITFHINLCNLELIIVDSERTVIVGPICNRTHIMLINRIQFGSTLV